MKTSCQLKTKNRVFILLVLSVFITNYLQAQKQYPKDLLPHMYVSDADAKERRAYFLKGKHRRLNHLFYTEKGHITCELTTWLTFLKSLDNSITHLRFYFAAFDKKNNYGKKKHLTLIVAPAIGKCGDQSVDIKDNGQYYDITDNGKIELITKEDKDDWKNYYYNHQLKKLKRTIDINNSDNRDGTDSSDTKSIVYYLPYFEQFIHTETDYQNASLTKKINGIEIDFCSYTSKGIDKGHYKDRMITQFEYLIDGTPFSIPNPNNQRIQDTNPCMIYKLNNLNNNEKSSGDNGQLCPANCPPPPPPDETKK